METLSYTISVEDATLLRDVLALRRESISSFTRRSVLRELARLGYLSSEATEALLNEVQGAAP